MAKTSVQDTVTGHPSSSSTAATTIQRNDDLLTQALRSGAALEMGDIFRLDRATSPAYEASLSLGSPTADIFSTHENSTSTKPTSTGTPSPNNLYTAKGKDRAGASNASSMSVACGSATEADTQRPEVRMEALLAMGGWIATSSVPDEPLRGAARAKARRHRDRSRRIKKPIVEIIQHMDKPSAPRIEDQESVVTIAATHNGSDKTYLRRRGTQHDENQLRLAEEGQTRVVQDQESVHKSLSRTRVYLLVVLIGLIILTIALSFLGAHYTGKGRIACTKGIVFGATVLTAFFTILAMIVASRAPHEALLAGLLEIITGFTLLLELDDFM